MEEVKFSGNNLHFPPAEVLARDWSSIKKYLKQFMTSSAEEKSKAESKTLNFTLAGRPNNVTRAKVQVQDSFKSSIVSTEENFTDFTNKFRSNR